MKRSHFVIIGGAGALIFAAASMQGQKCEADSNGVKPANCESASSGSSGHSGYSGYSGHSSSYGFGSFSAATARGGFGASGFGHAAGS